MFRANVSAQLSSLRRVNRGIEFVDKHFNEKQQDEIELKRRKIARSISNQRLLSSTTSINHQASNTEFSPVPHLDGSAAVRKYVGQQLSEVNTWLVDKAMDSFFEQEIYIKRDQTQMEESNKNRNVYANAHRLYFSITIVFV